GDLDRTLPHFEKLPAHFLALAGGEVTAAEVGTHHEIGDLLIVSELHVGDRRFGANGYRRLVAMQAVNQFAGLRPRDDRLAFIEAFLDGGGQRSHRFLAERREQRARLVRLQLLELRDLHHLHFCGLAPHLDFRSHVSRYPFFAMMRPPSPASRRYRYSISGY